MREEKRSLPTTDRDEAPLYLARYLQRQQDTPTKEETETDEATPLYLRRFRERPSPEEPTTNVPLYQRVGLGMQRSLSEDNRNKEISAPPEARVKLDADVYLVEADAVNAAVRAVVRAGLAEGLNVYGVFEGMQGLVDGGDRIQPMSSSDVGGILHQGGTVLGTARCAEFRTRDGRRRAARNLVERGIDALVVVGGDGSLTGTNLFREEWPELIAELKNKNVKIVAASRWEETLREAPGIVSVMTRDEIRALAIDEPTGWVYAAGETPIAGADRAHAVGRARVDQVTGFEPVESRQVGDDLGNGKVDAAEGSRKREECPIFFMIRPQHADDRLVPVGPVAGRASTWE